MNKKAFTLIELLAVIVIIGILGILTVPNVLEYFHESKIKAMLVQENKLVESGDILVRDYCKKPLNDQYRLECNDNYQSLENTNDETKIDDDPLTYTKYICISTLKDKDYYSEKLQFSGEDCSGVVVYRIDEETDIQKDSFAVVKCGTSYKTIFENENNEDYEEFLKTTTRADKLADVFKDCFTEQPVTPQPPETKKEYQLTINFTEHNQYGQQVAETISEKVLQGNRVKKDVPPYKSYDGTNEEHFTPFVHGSSDDVLNNSGNKVKPTIVSDELNFIMPANNVTINIAYSINQYTVTFNHIDVVSGTSTIGGQNYNSNSYKLFNGESVKIPYKEIPNFKIVSHDKETQIDYELKEHDNKTIDIEYQQINFNLTYDSKGGSTCPNKKTDYLAKLGTLCTTTKTGYRFQTWDVDGETVNSETQNKWYKDITLNANWDKNKYYVRYDCNSGTPTTPYESEHYYDTASKLAANQCKKEGHYFTKWTSEGGAEPSYTNEKDIMNLTNTHLGTVKLYATYSPHYLIVIYNPKDATTIKYEGNTKTVEAFKTESQSKYYYNTLTETGLANVQNDEYIYLERKGYKSTGNWYNGSIKLDEKVAVSGKTLAEHFGLDISNKNETLNIYPEWEIINYTITYNLNGGSNPSGAKKSYTVETNTYTLPTPTKPGYTFAGWYTTSNFSGSVVSQITKGSTGNKKYYAKWNSKIYRVTLNNQGATSAGTKQYWYYFNTSKKIDGEVVYYYLNQECTTPMKNYTITIPEKNGYTFGGYYSGTNGTGTQYLESTGGAINNIYSTKAEDTTLYAKWSKKTYTITYNLNGGTQGASPKTSYDVETITFNLPTPTKTGYSFGGWYTSADFSGSKVTSISKGTTGNKTYYAKWNANYIEVTYHPNGANDIRFKGTSMSDSQFMSTTKQKIYYDTYMEYGLPDIKNNDWFYLTRNGHRSTGKWYSGSYVIDQTTVITGKTLAEYFGLDISKESKNLDIYAQWQQCPANTYSNLGNNSCDACINGYYSSAGSTKCNPNEYTITYNLNGGTQGTNPKTSYNIETATFNLPTPTRTNYIFDGWYTTSNFSGSKVTSISKGSTGNKTYYAKWILYIYNEGTTNTAVTGGWDTRGLDHYPAVSYNAEVKPIVTYNSTYISINQNNYAYGNSGFLYTKNKINLSEFKKLYMVVDYDIGNYNYGFGAIDALNATTWQDDTAVEYEFPRESSGGKITKVIDISGVTGNWNVHIGCVSYTGTSKFNVYKIWLEP